MVIGAAWLNKTQNVESFFSCVLNLPFFGKIKFSIFKNKEKMDKGPDYQIVWYPEEGKGDKKEGDLKTVDPFSDADIPF